MGALLSEAGHRDSISRLARQLLRNWARSRKNPRTTQRLSALRDLIGRRSVSGGRKVKPIPSLKIYEKKGDPPRRRGPKRHKGTKGHESFGVAAIGENPVATALACRSGATQATLDPWAATPNERGRFGRIPDEAGLLHKFPIGFLVHRWGEKTAALGELRWRSSQ